MGNSSISEWHHHKLKDCLTLTNGRAYSQNELLGNGTPIIRIQNLNGGENWYYSDLVLDKDKYCGNGDLLFAWSTTFGPYIWNGNRAIYHYHIWKVTPKENCDKFFAYYYLLHLTKEIKSQSHGVAMVHITKGKMEDWDFPLPPLPEQRRIVAKLDSLFERIDKAIALVEENIKNAQSLMASVLEEVFEHAEEKGWVVLTIGECFDLKTGGTPSTKNRKYYDNGTIKWLVSGDINQGEIFDCEGRITELAINS